MSHLYSKKFRSSRRWRWRMTGYNCVEDGDTLSLMQKKTLNELELKVSRRFLLRLSCEATKYKEGACREDAQKSNHLTGGMVCEIWCMRCSSCHCFNQRVHGCSSREADRWDDQGGGVLRGSTEREQRFPALLLLFCGGVMRMCLPSACFKNGP